MQSQTKAETKDSKMAEEVYKANQNLIAALSEWRNSIARIDRKTFAAYTVTDIAWNMAHEVFEHINFTREEIQKALDESRSL